MPSPLISFAFPLQFGLLSWVLKVEAYIDFTIIKDINLRVLGQFPLLEKKGKSETSHRDRTQLTHGPIYFL